MTDDRPVKVTFCANDRPAYVGGPNTWLRRLLPDLARRGFVVRVLFLTQGGPSPSVAALRKAGVRCDERRGIRHTEDRVRWVLERLKEDAPDVFVPNLSIPGLFAAGMLKGAGIPSIGVLHSDDRFYDGVIDEFVAGKPERRLSAVVCVSRRLEDKARRAAGGGTLVKRISYGAPFSSKISTLNGGLMRILYAGRFVERQKKILGTAQAICRAVREVPATEAVFYGDGPMRGDLEAMIGLHSAGRPVRVHGPMDSDDIQARMAEGHVFVLMSDYEGLPIALLEAMAAGVVPICRRISSGVPELVEDGVNGFLVDGEDAFVAAVRRLREDPALWARMSEATRSRVAAEHGMDACARRWEKLLRSLAAGSPGPKAVRVPSVVELPPVHSGLAHEDPRRPARRFKNSREEKHAMRICVAHPMRQQYTETFITAHVRNLPAKVFELAGGLPPIYLEGKSLVGQHPLSKGLRYALRAALRLPEGYFHEKAIAKFLRSGRVDAVLAEYGPTGVNLLRACREARVPLTVHFHGYDAHDQATLTTYAEGYKKLFAQAAAIVAVSRPMADQLVALGAPKKKVHYNPCGVDLAKFKQSDPVTAPPVFVAAGRFTDKKAPFLTLLAFQKTLAACPAARLVMIGEGALLETCRRLTQSLKLTDAVEFRGARPHDEVAAAMAGARAFVQHSVRAGYGDSEGTPVAVLEAAASGLPVVSTAHAGIPDVVVPGETGFLVPEGDVEGMAEAMTRLAKDPALAGRLGRAARETLSERFHMEKNVRALFEIIKATAGKTT